MFFLKPHARAWKNLGTFVCVFMGTGVCSTTALAHIHVSPQKMIQGGRAKLIFSVKHGCKGSPTQKLQVQIPKGIASFHGVEKAGWKIQSTNSKEAEGAERKVAWSGGSIPNESTAEFVVEVTVNKTAAGILVFPVLQGCEKGELKWVDVPAKEGAVGGEKETEAPAPTVKIITAQKR